jgi:UDP-3-O-[3-hydroxymyristoyl] glucosamine N-acyltransferase
LPKGKSKTVTIMKAPLSKIARLVQGRISGDSGILISGAAPFEQADAHEITVAGSAKFLKKMGDCNAAAILVSRDINDKDHNLVQVDNPMVAFAKVTAAIFIHVGSAPGLRYTPVLKSAVEFRHAANIRYHRSYGGHR